MFYIILLISIPVTSFLTYKVTDWILDWIYYDSVSEWNIIRAALTYSTPYKSNVFSWCGQPVRMTYTIRENKVYCNIEDINL